MRRSVTIFWHTFSHSEFNELCENVCHKKNCHRTLIIYVCACDFDFVGQMWWLSHMNSVKWPCSSWVLLPQWTECPPSVKEVMSLFLGWDSDFPLSHILVILISSLFTFHQSLKCTIFIHVLLISNYQHINMWIYINTGDNILCFYVVLIQWSKQSPITRVAGHPLFMQPPCGSIMEDLKA